MSRPEAPFAVCWSSVGATEAAHAVIEAAQRYADALCCDAAGAPTVSPAALVALLEAVRVLASENARVRREWGEDSERDSDLARRLANIDAGDDDAGDECAHEWVSTGTNDGGDDSRFHGEGRTYCTRCGADGDA